MLKIHMGEQQPQNPKLVVDTPTSIFILNNSYVLSNIMCLIPMLPSVFELQRSDFTRKAVNQ